MNSCFRFIKAQSVKFPERLVCFSVPGSYFDVCALGVQCFHPVLWPGHQCWMHGKQPSNSSDSVPQNKNKKYITLASLQIDFWWSVLLLNLWMKPNLNCNILLHRLEMLMADTAFLWLNDESFFWLKWPASNLKYCSVTS